jgi:hypothetical protein
MQVCQAKLRISIRNNPESNLMAEAKQASELSARMDASPKPAIDMMDGRVRNFKATVAITQDIVQQKSRAE